jgi:hypothetical protein
LIIDSNPRRFREATPTMMDSMLPLAGEFFAGRPSISSSLYWLVFIVRRIP